MGYRKFKQRGQAALEYMLLLTVVAIVVLIAIKPSTTNKSILNRAQEDTEGYYNTITETIMGKNPRPIDGGLCPPKPSGYQECACPQPAFGGAPCPTTAGGGPPLVYCGDGICNGSETGEPGHPVNGSDPLVTCFTDCAALDCSNCATITPGTQCGATCGGVTCQGLEVCNVSSCSSGCAGYTATCVQDTTLCSGSCACSGAWVPIGGCGVTVGSCTPTPFQMCMQNNNCNSSCTPAQTIQARPDPSCGQCPQTPVSIPCGSGTVNLPPTMNGSTANVACPAGCAPGTMQSTCTNGSFGVLVNICLPTDCPSTAVSDPDCGGANLPSVPHGNVGQVACPNFCGGTFYGTCNLGTYTGITDACIPRPCGATVMTTINCGNVTLPAVGNGVISATGCGPGCTGNYSARCSNASFVSVNDQCYRDCAIQSFGTPCGNVSTPGSVPHGSPITLACPAGCTTGNITATCTNGTFTGVTNGCQQDCAAASIPTAQCGSVTIPGTPSGNNSSSGCPAPCSGTASATCTNGSFTGFTENCTQPACSDTTMSTVNCGSLLLPGVPNGVVSSAGCPSGCTGTYNATCSAGTFTGVNDQCFQSCPAQNYSTASCGTVTIPAASNGAVSPAGCPGGCTGSASATCSNGTFFSFSENCTQPNCPATNVGSVCGTITLPSTPNGSPVTVGCPGCFGSYSANCSGGVFSGNVDNCAPQYCFNQAGAAPLIPNNTINWSWNQCFATVITSVDSYSCFPDDWFCDPDPFIGCYIVTPAYCAVCVH